MQTPVPKRPDYQYHDLLVRIRQDGFPVQSQQEEKQYRVVGCQLRFPLENGFPLITERDLSGKLFDQALGELCGFLNGARTLEALKSFGNHWWKNWVT